MHIKATHEKEELYGTLEVLKLSEHEIVFALYMDDRENPPDNWCAFEASTLSGIVAEAERRGLSDIKPIMAE